MKYLYFIKRKKLLARTFFPYHAEVTGSMYSENFFRNRYVQILERNSVCIKVENVRKSVNF